MTATLQPAPCQPDQHPWSPVGETLTVRDPRTGAPVGCQLQVRCEACGVEAVATWDLPPWH